MAFTTVTGSNGVTSLVGTTGIDTATIVTLDSNIIIRGNTGDDNITTALGTGGNNVSDLNALMGGGDDVFTQNDTLLNAYLSLDGATLANDGNDVLNGGGAGNLIINSEVVGRGGNDTLGATNALLLSGSTVNGNTGLDTINIGASATSFVYGGRDTDTITVSGNSSAVLVNGNKGADDITVNAVTFSGGSVYGGAGNDTIVMNSTTDGVLVSGDNGVDNITTNAGDDTVNGGSDNDIIVTAAGVDTINGGSGDDNITAGAGADVITGGAGNDAFVIGATDSILTATSLSAGFDTITDFSANTAAVGAALNGDQLDVAALGAGGYALAGTSTFANGGAADLNAALVNAQAAGQIGALANAGDASAVTITGSVAWAGNYIIQNNAGVGYTLGDTVIKVNSFAGVGATTFI